MTTMVWNKTITMFAIYRKVWRRHNALRIGVFWFGSLVVSVLVIMVIATDWITWDRLNRDFVSSTGKWRTNKQINSSKAFNFGIKGITVSHFHIVSAICLKDFQMVKYAQFFRSVYYLKKNFLSTHLKKFQFIILLVRWNQPNWYLRCGRAAVRNK